MTYTIMIQDKTRKGIIKNLYLKKVTNFQYKYTRMAQDLVDRHGLSWDTKIAVRYMRYVDTPTFKNHRTNFKHPFCGTVKEFKEWLLKDAAKNKNKKNKSIHKK